MDMVRAIKHVYENAEIYGVDKSKISLSGDSGGGLVALAAATQLVKRGESGLIKLFLPD